MLAALTSGGQAEGQPDACPNPKGSGGAARRSAALERLAQARRQPDLGHAGAAEPGSAAGFCNLLLPAGPAIFQNIPGAAGRTVHSQAPSVLLLADGCMAAEGGCQVGLHRRSTGPATSARITIQGSSALLRPGGAAPPAAQAAGTAGSAGAAALPELQAALLRAASPAPAAFLDVQALKLNSYPGVPGWGAGSGADGSDSQTSWLAQGQPAGWAGEHLTAADGAFAGSGACNPIPQGPAAVDMAAGRIAGRPASGGCTGAWGSAGQVRGAAGRCRSARAYISPSTRAGASWGSINAAPIAPLPPRRPRAASPAPRRRSGSASGTGAGSAASEAAARTQGTRARAHISARLDGAEGADGGVGQREGDAAAASSGGGAEARAGPTPAEVAGLLEAVRSVEALALAVREDTRTSRQVPRPAILMHPDHWRWRHLCMSLQLSAPAPFAAVHSLPLIVPHMSCIYR